MNRRAFISGAAKALAGFSILPAATTYTRLWKAVVDPRQIPNPDWVDARYEFAWVEFKDPGLPGSRIIWDENPHIIPPWIGLLEKKHYSKNLGNCVRSLIYERRVSLGNA